MHTEIFGTSLPDTPLGWISALVLIWGALLTTLAAVEKSLESLGIDVQLLRPFGGLALPVGWVAWSFALIYAYRSTASVVIVLGGTLVITVTARTLVQRCKVRS